MSCRFPRGVYRYDGTLSHRPCGQCMGCRLENSRQWAMRCVHEASMHDTNCFITLTYSPEHLPEDKSIQKAEVSRFLKRLRKSLEKTDIKIRFFGCGEYGDKNDRPHYHLCIFGYDFPDKELHKIYKSNPYYISEKLDKIWGKGYCWISDLTFQSAAYVARYVTKKITGEIADKHYKGKQPEFALMSRMPGIGRLWIDKYLGDVYPKDFVTLNGIRMRPCRYYDSVMAKHDVHQWMDIKQRRIEQSDNTKVEYDPKVINSHNRYDEYVSTEHLKRSFEDEKG